MKRRVYVYYGLALLFNFLLILLLNLSIRKQDLEFDLTHLGFVVAYMLWIGIFILSILICIHQKNYLNPIFLIIVELLDVIVLTNDKSPLLIPYYMRYIEFFILGGSLFIQYLRANEKKNQKLDCYGMPIDNSNSVNYANNSEVGRYNNYIITPNNPMARTLQPGIVTLWYQIVRVALVFVAATSAGIFSFSVFELGILSIASDMDFTFAVTGFILLLIFMASISIIYVLNPINILIRKKLYDKVDWAGFTEKCEYWKKRENLHQSTISYLTALEALVLLYDNIDEAIALFDTTNYPSSARQNKIYSYIRMRFCLMVKDFEQAEYFIRIEKNTHRKLKLIMLYNIYALDNKIDNIEEHFKINSRICFKNIIVAYDLMRYYYTRGDINKSKYYAKFIIDQKIGYKYLTDLSERILNDSLISDFNNFKE